ncbi:MAG: rhodanese-like domain-containing protein [Gemmatimonadota bacterium]|nr:rhodanese-like domain-containing protein [Gemmatimonadota bacterium]MDQ6872210.1 rhodanese-like domain-containing protein [Gemmatimonadota bacterium]
MIGRIRCITLAALGLVPASGTARALASPQPVIVSADWLRAHHSDPDLVIIAIDMPSMGEMPDPYPNGHIPGARVLEYHAIATMGGEHELSTELVSADSLKSVFESLGVSDKSRIILYASSRVPTIVTRTFFTLDYLGLGERVSVLDGGLDAWKVAGGKVEKGAPRNYPRGLLHLNTRPEVLVTGPWLRGHLTDRSFTLVDARAPEFYTGAKEGHSASALGHVPSAHNLYYATLLDSKGFFKPDVEARALFEQAGVPINKPVIVYCHIGQTATVVYFEARRLGIPVKLYDGSFEDWSRHTDYPRSKGTTPE